jgi:hypothetical protein
MVANICEERQTISFEECFEYMKHARWKTLGGARGSPYVGLTWMCVMT